jgi:hypothetical protein
VTLVRFRWKSAGEALKRLRVPVEVRTPSLALVTRAVTSGSVDLEPGTYHFSARLPNGAAWSRVMRVSGAQKTVVLEPEREIEADPLSYFAGPVGHGGLGGPTSGGQGGLGGPPVVEESWLAAVPKVHVRPAPQGSGRGRLRCFTADPLHGVAARVDLPGGKWPRRADAVHLEMPPSSQRCFVQLLQTGRVPVNIALPRSHVAGCVVVVRSRRKRFWMEVHPDNDDANLLLGYKKNQAPQEEALIAERLLAGKFDDPIAATIGAYSLLRFGDLEKLHDWPENLRRSFPWLSDGAAIRGEQLARLGRHAEAFPAFLECAERGLPLMSDGIDYVLQRLKLYTTAETGFAAAELERATGVLRRLQAISGFVDFNQPLVTVNGVDPGNPDGEPLKRLPTDGEDLAALFA